MQIATTFRVLGILLMIFSLSMVPPLAIALWYHDGGWTGFLAVFLITFFTGLGLWLVCYKHQRLLKVRDGFLIVVLFWSVLSFFGALPLIFAVTPHVSLTNAIFESVSGLTTTGLTILSNIDQLPHAILYYRQQLQFLGGMGIVVLAVAILPMLGIGGMQLYRAETPGPAKDNKLTPRVAQTAKVLWFIYLSLCILCALAYWADGMSLFDAIGESFGTVSTGGFSMHDSSFAYYQSHAVLITGAFFMLLGGINFSLHFVAMQRRSLRQYWRDPECMAYLKITLLATLLIFAVLFIHHTYKNNVNALLDSVFMTISALTTTGFSSTTFQAWPVFLPSLIMFMGMVGGCAASTSGGIKIVRVILMLKQGLREIVRLIHPNAVVTMKLGEKVIPDELLQAVWSFISFYVILFVTLTFLLLACGLSLEAAEGDLVASFANLGVTIGSHYNDIASLNIPSKWILIFAMIAGRLEIFSVLVLFSPAFWRK